MKLHALLLAGVPLAAALTVHSSTLPGDFCLDDGVLAERRADLRSADPRMVFLERYLRPDRPDPGFRPLTFLTYTANYSLGGAAWTFRAINILLHAAAACLAYAVLARVLGDLPLAAMGAALFAVLPTHADAVARILGRGEVLAGLSLFAILALTLRSAPDTGPEPPLRAFLVGGIALLGLLAGPGSLILSPVILLCASALFSRRVALRSVLAATAAVIGYLLLRETVLEGPRLPVSEEETDLASWIAQLLNGIRLVGLHAFEVVAPIHLSADYSHAQVSLLSLSSPILWCMAAGIVGTALLATWLAWPRGEGQRRWPAGGFAALFFVVAAVGPAIAAAFQGGPIFAERDAYAASLAFPLAVAAALGAWFPVRGRGLALAFLAVLAVAYGARTWARNRDWADARTMALQTALDAPRSARAHLWAAEAYFTPWRESGPEAPGSPGDARRKEDLRMAVEEVQRSLAIEEGWRARAALGEILLEEKRYAEAVAELDRAEVLLAKAEPLRRDPMIRAARGEARLRAIMEGTLKVEPRKKEEPDKPTLWELTLADLETSIRLYDLLGRRPRARVLGCRGFVLAQGSKLEEALRDFQRASEIRPQLAQIWQDSGFCRFQLKDYDGAIKDYEKGLEICRQKGLLNAPSGDSAVAFLLRITNVHIERAKVHRAAGNETLARGDEERAAALQAEAAALAAPAKNP